jgi:hypothetical protein
VSDSGVPSQKLGVVAGTSLTIDTDVNLNVDQLKEVYESVIPSAMAQKA